MARLPPKIVRRLVLAPLALAISLALVSLSPLLLLAAAVVDLLTSRRRWRNTRIAAFGAVYLAFEAVGIVALFVLWIASGFGRRLSARKIQEAHYGFMRWWLAYVNRAASALFRLEIRIEDRPTPRAGPILVFSRHAGPGNSMMLIGTIMVGYKRNPRIVMLAKVQWEPLADVMFNRLPNRFIEHDPQNRDRYVEAIKELAGGLGDRDAFVLFPEGRNFTPRHRRRAIARLRRKGHQEEAEKAEQLTRMLPPRHSGVMAALEGAPGADVVFVAHTVLEDVGSFRDLWNRVPFDRPILSRYWRISPEAVPRDRDQLIDWLYAWWEEIDTWIETRRAMPAGHAEPAGLG
jgi:hypothetical protein